MMNLHEKKQTIVQKNWKSYLGIGFLVSCVLALAFLIVPFLGFSAGKTVSLLTVLAIIAELFFLLSILLICKIFIQKIKEKLRTWFKKQEPAVPVYIGKHRHYIGVLLFFLSFIPYPIIEISLLGLPPGAQHINFFILLLTGDILFVISLFVPGDPFWEKISLFSSGQNYQPAVDHKVKSHKYYNN